MTALNTGGALMGVIMTGVLIAVAGPAAAQIKPETSGKPSFSEPELRRHREGLVRPNAPHRHRRRHGFIGAGARSL